MRSKRVPNPNFAPISAAGYFEEAVQVAVPSRHLDCRVYYTSPKVKNGTVMICHHGAGYSGLTFACFAKEVTDMTKGECGVLALDARRHGIYTFYISIIRCLQVYSGKTTSSGDDSDLSVDVLIADFCAILQAIYPDPTSAPTFLVRLRDSPRTTVS